MTRGDKAKKFFLQGYNSAQSVVLAFSDMIDADTKTLAMLSQPFGVGTRGLKENCGAVSGMWIVMGALFGGSEPHNPKKINELYARMNTLSLKFEQDNKSLICRELVGLTPIGGPKGLIGGKPIQAKEKKRPCPDLCKYAADILEEYVNAHKNDIVYVA